MGVMIASRKDFLNPQNDVLYITSIFEMHPSTEDKDSITCNHKLKLVQSHKKWMQKNAKLHSCMAAFPPLHEGATTASATFAHQ